MNDYKELVIWQKGMEIVRLVYKLTSDYPKCEKYVLVSQMRRCAISIPSNIAEGFRRRYTKDIKRFAIIAYGSIAELETQLLISADLDYCSVERGNNLAELLVEASKMINSFIKSLRC